MNYGLKICFNTADKKDLSTHLWSCDSIFIPKLSERIKIGDYVDKISAMANRFEAWESSKLIGLLAVYCNDDERRFAFITNVSVLPGWRGLGVASLLLVECIEYVRQLDFECIELEVNLKNSAAVSLYEKHGFLIKMVVGQSVIMSLPVSNRLKLAERIRIEDSSCN